MYWQICQSVSMRVKSFENDKKKLRLIVFLPLKTNRNRLFRLYLNASNCFFLLLIIDLFFYLVKIHTYFQAATAQFVCCDCSCVRSSKKAIQRNYTKKKLVQHRRHLQPFQHHSNHTLYLNIYFSSHFSNFKFHSFYLTHTMNFFNEFSTTIGSQFKIFMVKKFQRLFFSVTKSMGKSKASPSAYFFSFTSSF